MSLEFNKRVFFGSLLTGVLLVAIAVGLYFGLKWRASNALKGEVYQLTLNHINRDEAVARCIGVPVMPELFVSGEINEQGQKGRINLTFNVSGSKGSGSVNVYAYKEAGQWKLFEVVVNCYAQNERIHVYSPHWEPRHNEKLLNK